MQEMLFKGNSSRLELLIEKIQANKENQDVIDSHIPDALGTEAGSSWGSEGQTSPPSSCATPNSATDVPDSELTFTVGVTDATPYPCQFCDKAFPRLSFLKKHEQSHSEYMPFQCEFCSRRFKHKRSRDRHIKLHTGDKKYRCTQCAAAFSRSDHLKIHMKTHDNRKPFQCTECNRGYNTAAALTSHMQNHKKSSDTPSPTPGTTFKCLQCADVFRKPEDLQNHMVSQHNIESSGNSPATPSPRRHHLSPHYPSSPRLACMYCTKDNFSTMESLQIHVHSMHRSILNGELQRDLGLFSPQSSQSLSPSLHSHRILSTPPLPAQPYCCDLCTMRFHSVSALQKHALTVHGFRAKEAGSLFCVHCRLQFPTPALFAEHYVLFHGTTIGLFAQTPVEQVKPTDLSLTKKSSPGEDIRPSKRLRHGENGISSSSNGVESSRKTSTVNHHQYGHRGPLLCNNCNAVLPDFEAFRSHVKTHLDEAGGLRGLLGGGSEPCKTPPVVCPHCGVQLPSPDELPQHLTSHFLVTAAEYGCQSCMKLYPTPDELQKHLMDLHTHHLYRCSLCKETFDSKVTIQMHFAMKHSSEAKLYRCNTCLTGAVYRTEMDFTLHIRTVHTPQHILSPKPSVVQPPQMFRCLFCRLSFPTELEMHLHLAEHTKHFRCHLCPETFHIEFLLDKHIQTYHPDQVLNGTDEVEHSHTVKGGRKTPSNHNSNILSRSNNNISDANKKQDSVNNNIGSTCEICERSDFANDAELAAHRKLVHHIKSSPTGKLSLNCAYCNETFKSRADLENHMKSHSQGCVTQGKHKCNICDELCTSAVILAEHKLTHCKIINGKVCTQCKASITNQDQFYQHLRQHSGSSLAGNGSPTAQPVLPTVCIICRQTLVSDAEVRMHARHHYSPTELSPCSVCLQGYDRRDLMGGVCKECHHRHLNGKTTPSRCSDCQLKFETGPALEAHIASVHRKSFQCVKSQVSFETEKEIQLHIATHLMTEGSSGLECRLCLRLMDSPLQLQTHLIEHTFAGCPTFACYICSAVFTAAQGLQLHMLEHGLAARPYDCPHCSQRFFFRAELDNHSFMHTDVLENQGKPSPMYSFQPKTESLDSSTRTSETQEMKSKNWNCSTCNKECESLADLQSHIHQHSSSEYSLSESQVEALKTEIKKESMEEEYDDEEEQIDVGDHHSEEPLRSPDVMLSTESCEQDKTELPKNN